MKRIFNPQYSAEKIFLPIILAVIAFLSIGSIWALAYNPTSIDTRSRAVAEGYGMIVPIRPNTTDICRNLSKSSVIEVKVPRINPRSIQRTADYQAQLICTARTIISLRLTAERAVKNNIRCDYLGYYPDKNAGSPLSEANNLIQSFESAKKIADQYGAKLLVAPSEESIENAKKQNPDFYSEAAEYANAWLIQTMSYQVTEDGTKTSVNDYSTSVKAIADELKSNNATIEIWAHLSVTAGTDGRRNPFTGEELISYIESVEKFTTGVRIYDSRDPNRPDTLRQIAEEIEGKSFDGEDPYACQNSTECSWCGSTCAPTNAYHSCPTDTPPADTKCICKNNSCQTQRIRIPVPPPVPDPIKPKGCALDSECGWCGRSCLKEGAFKYCPDVMPPEGSECRCIDHVCTMTEGGTSQTQ